MTQFNAHEAWEQFKRFMRPPVFVPQYGGLEWASREQRELNRATLLGLSFDAIMKGQEVVGEMHTELREEATRLIERELQLVTNSQKLHANAVQFGLVAAGIVASLGSWLNLHWAGLPLIAFILSIAAAWWFLCQQEPDWNTILEAWHQDLPKIIGEVEVPDRFRKEIYLHLYERIFYLAIRNYRLWLHMRLIVPASLFVLGLGLLLACVAFSGE